METQVESQDRLDRLYRARKVLADFLGFQDGHIRAVEPDDSVFADQRNLRKRMGADEEKQSSQPPNRARRHANYKPPCPLLEHRRLLCISYYDATRAKRNTFEKGSVRECTVAATQTPVEAS